MGGFNNTWNVGWVAVGTFVDTDTMQFGLKFSDILDIIGKKRKVSYILDVTTGCLRLQIAVILENISLKLMTQILVYKYKHSALLHCYHGYVRHS